MSHGHRQAIRLAQTAPPRQRVRTSGVVAWLFLLATMAWWVLDESGSGWPAWVTIVAVLWVVREVNEAWVARDLASAPPPPAR